MWTRTRADLTAAFLSRRSELEAISTGGPRKALLMCGIVSSVYYVAINIYVPTQWPGYSTMSQAVSELSAIGAPTRTLWVLLCIPYTLMVIAFGYGVRISARGSRALVVVGSLFMADAIMGVFWPPMHLPEVGPTLTDTLHIAWTIVWLTIMLVAMGFSLVAFGKRFRLFTLATLAAFVGFGTLTSLEGFRLANGLPTPFLGLWERVNMGAAMVWIAVVAATLLRREIRCTSAKSP